MIGQKDPLEQGRRTRTQYLPRDCPPRTAPHQFLCLLVRIGWTPVPRVVPASGRDELLRVLTIRDGAERAREIGNLHQSGLIPATAELLIDAEEDPYLPAVLVGMLREADRWSSNRVIGRTERACAALRACAAMRDCSEGAGPAQVGTFGPDAPGPNGVPHSTWR